MSDLRARELERRWRETGALEDRVAWLRQRMRGGELPLERLALAAAVGDAASGEVLGWPADLEARLTAVGEVEVRALVRGRLAPGMAAWRTLIPEAGAAGAAAAKRPPGG